MRGVNKAIILGRLGADPELRVTGGGRSVLNISIATNRFVKKGEGNLQEETEWHRVVLFGRLAELSSKYLKKGNAVYIEGRLRTRRWQTEEGENRYMVEIVGERIEFLNGKPEGREEVIAKEEVMIDEDIPF